MLKQASSDLGLIAQLAGEFSAATRGRGAAYHADGRVTIRERTRTSVSAHVDGTRRYQVAIASDGRSRVRGACSCPVADAFEPCKHLWAVLCALGHDLLEIPFTAQMSFTLVEDFSEVTAPVAPRRGDGTWRDRVGDFGRTTVRRPTAPRVPLALQYLVEVLRPFPTAWAPDGVSIRFAKVRTFKDGTQQRSQAPLTRDDLERLPAEDREIVDAAMATRVLSTYGHGHIDAPRGVWLGGPALGTMLPRMAATGRLGWMAGPTFVPLAWAAEPYRLEVRMTRSGGKVRAIGALVHRDDRVALESIEVVLCTELVIAGGRLLRVDVDDLPAWTQLLSGALTIPSGEVPELVAATCSGPRPPVLEVGAIGWKTVDAAPVPSLALTAPARGQTTFSGRVLVRYGDATVTPCEGNPITVDASRRSLLRRDLAAEAAYARDLLAAGVVARASRDLDVTVPVDRFVRAMEVLLEAGWEVLVAGRPVRAGGAVQAKVATGIDWFDLELAYETGGAAAATPALLAALRRGMPFVELSDGGLGLLPAAWLERHGGALRHAEVSGGALRFRRGDTLALAAVIDDVPQVDVDAGFRSLRERLDGFAGIEAEPAPAGFSGALRHYQQRGLGWMSFLRELGFGGCLADDMGLGKTVQVLAMLAGRPAERSPRTSLVVAPRSVVFNWCDEARRFAPALRVVEWHGPGREVRVEALDDADLVVTTYATLRRDLGRFVGRELDYVILDEAQMIKNPGSRAAIACKQLRARHRLALTGTPVENHLGDLASIFEFLNPGMLGNVDALRSLAAPPSDHDPEAARRVGRVLRPFLLRRTKEEVLTDLPAKTEQRLLCRLDGEERRLYDDLRDHYREALLGKVDALGVGAAAIHVLEALLRLRQAACHPGLIDPARANAGSAKLEVLVAQLREVIGGQHRALVFSQFTSMLALVARRLDEEGIPYEYLDGKTLDRKERVRRFQHAEGAPVFLISLKAGGTGLNLTAADYVFLLDPWWNPAVESQAIDRVHRIGQSRPVIAYRLVAEDTVEAKVLDLQERKRAVFDGLFEERRMLSALTADDLRAILE